MRITLNHAAIGSGLGAAVPPLSLTVSPDVPTVIAVETDERPLVVSMLLGGRIQPDAGTVTVDGRIRGSSTSLSDLRRATALVDTPFVAEPPAGIPLVTVVAEELSFAGLPASRRAADKFLQQHGVAEYGRLPIRALPPTHRVRLFSELALLRPGVEALVITSPERHGGDAARWYDVLAEIAARGIAIAIVTDAATRDILVRLGARDASEPLEDIEPEPESPEAA